jgi:hypothetical protein
MKCFALLHTKMKLFVLLSIFLNFSPCFGDLHPLHLKMLLDVNQMWKWFRGLGGSFSRLKENHGGDTQSLNQGFTQKCISTLVSSENEEFDEQQASWKINCYMKGSWF